MSLYCIIYYTSWKSNKEFNIRHKMPLLMIIQNSKLWALSVVRVVSLTLCLRYPMNLLILVLLQWKMLTSQIWGKADNWWFCLKNEWRICFISSVNINWKMLTLARPKTKTDEEIFSKYVKMIYSCIWFTYF